MKKKYIAPAIGFECMDTCYLLTPSLYHADEEKADAGSESSTVNLGRGSFWDETEK